ncbi:hypothetical protein SAMD00024442_33_16 [Candidatus Symbiothrix dinenymphae]|nr:hypothetical protein SAMD00024442_33_16 [Candidatus Symbiothrix dinenymphae]
MQRIVFGIGLLVVGCCPGWAQFDGQVSSYWAVKSYYNPGSTALTADVVDVTGLYRLQWLGIVHAPRTGIVTAESPMEILGVDVGLGLSMYNDQIGLFSTSLMSGQVSKSFNWAKGKISVGLRGGMLDQSFNGAQVVTPDDLEDGVDADTETGAGTGAGGTAEAADKAIPRSNVSDNGFDMGLGVFYEREKWSVGLSVNHLLAPELKLGETTTFTVPRTYYLMAEYNINLNNPLLELKPSILVKSVEMGSQTWNQTQLDVSMRLVYNNMLWGGLSWRPGDALMVMLGGKYKDLNVGYVYDIPMSDIIQETYGSHEIFIKYSIDMSNGKKKKGKHKSVRLL